MSTNDGNARKLATWDDLLCAPDDGSTYEIIAGVMEALPRPQPGHSNAQALISGELTRPFQRGRGGPGGRWILIEPDVELTDNDIVVPDLAGWKRDNLPEFPHTRPIRFVPDWICEVLSPSNQKRDRVVKADLYLASGVPHYWIVDVRERTLEAYSAKEGSWVRLGAWTDGDTHRIPPFEAIEIEAEGLFPPPPSSTAIE